MNDTITIILFCWAGFIILFVLCWSIGVNNYKHKNIILDIPVNKIHAENVIKEIEKETEKNTSKRPISNILIWGNKYPPKSMSAGAKYLYKIKPNLQYWINIHGSGILDRSVEELKGEKLFTDERNCIQDTMLRKTKRRRRSVWSNRY